MHFEHLTSLLLLYNYASEKPLEILKEQKREQIGVIPYTIVVGKLIETKWIHFSFQTFFFLISRKYSEIIKEILKSKVYLSSPIVPINLHTTMYMIQYNRF